MNIGAFFSKAADAARKIGGKAVLSRKKYSPELMIAGGIVSFVLTIVETAKSTNESRDILEEKEQKELIISDEMEENDSYTAIMAAADTKALTRQTRWALVKCWMKAGVPAVVTVIFFLGGFGKMKGRYVASAAAYDGLNEFMKRYRGNVRNEFGEEVDWRMAHSLTAEQMEEERRKQIAIREKKETQKKQVPRTQYEKDINNQIFDARSSDRWKPYWNATQMLDFIQQIESQLQDMVEMNGLAVLNDAYKLLGMPLTAQGAVVGWVKTPTNTHREGGNRVSLGFANNETPPEEIRRILGTTRNEDLYAWITPNCDGVVYQLYDVPFSQR